MRVVLGLSIAMLLSALPARAAVIVATDNEAEPAYADGWQPGDSGGFGWGGAWSFLNQSNVAITFTNGSRGWFVGDSRGNDSGGVAGDSNGDFDINTPASATGKAWGIYSNTTNSNTDQMYAVRPFASTLQVGQTISFDLDNGNVASTQVMGVRLLSNAGDVASRVWEFRFVGGDANYTVIANPNTTSTMPFTREGVHVDYTLTGASTFTLVAKRLVDGTTYTLNGTNANANSINGIAFKNQLAGTGATNDGFFNNLTLSTVPEPACLGLVLLSSGILMRRRATHP